MRVFKNKWFNRFCKKQKINDEMLVDLIVLAEKGIIDADYGGSLIKQRLARPNEGKSGGYISIILYRMKDKAFFVYGFAKKDRSNLSDDEEFSFKELAKEMIGLDDNALDQLVLDKALIEVKYDSK